MKRIIKSNKSNTAFEINPKNLPYYSSKESAEAACKRGQELAKQHIELMKYLEDK